MNDIELKMWSNLPRFYEEIKEFNEILSNESIELSAIDETIENTVDQYFIDSSTWSLARREIFFGLPVIESKPIEQRRAVLKSKLRGAGVTTAELIKNVAESYSNGFVEVFEENSTYVVRIKFTGTLGIPPNLSDLEQALRDIIPAHLGIVFEYSYLFIKDIHNVLTLTQMEAITLDKFAGGA